MINRKKNLFIKVLVVLTPWRVRRHLLKFFFGYDIHKTAKIGFSWVFPKMLIMREHARIGSLNVAVNIDKMLVGAHSIIERRNWITGFPTGTKSAHFAHQVDRKCELIIGSHSAITKNHHIDCTSSIVIGDFVTIAGYFSQFLTHSIDLRSCRQASSPIEIGDYCFVGTNVVILGGSALPRYSVLGAKSLLNKLHVEERCLYAGVPAGSVKRLDDDVKYFKREIGSVT